ncbi:XK-related protein 9 [Callorhinchus milii]|uniref:XK-related protein 9 n=1 Tax=Callorhinchus milii TaxID=7868 RepID=UPI001C3FF486|nr:XK-related protein 9 [Callorhinchus milii]
MSSEGRFGRFDFTMVVTGLFLYVGDVGTDLWVALSFWREGRVVWFALVLGSMLLAAVTIQIFSLSWHCDDQKQSRQNGSESQPPPCHHYCRMPFLCLGLLHVFQMGIPVRIFLVLKCGYMTAFKDQDDHWKAIYLATDLSMLRLFEAFLETAPQLILQTFILLQYEHRNYIQYLSVIASCTSISWATLDYYVALRKSLPLKKKLVCGLPYVTYVLYKWLTLCSKILSMTLLATLHIIGIAAYVSVMWIIMITWVLKQNTKFTTSKCQEFIYRLVVSIIMIFTFFNIKGQNTRLSMGYYYVLRIVETFVIVLLCWLLKDPSFDKGYDLPVSIVIGVTLVMGIFCLILYYVFFQPNSYAKNTDVEESNNLNNGTGSEVYYDEVDGNLSNGQNENSQRNHEADTYHKRKYLRQKMFLLE